MLSKINNNICVVDQAVKAQRHRFKGENKLGLYFQKNVLTKTTNEQNQINRVIGPFKIGQQNLTTDNKGKQNKT